MGFLTGKTAIITGGGRAVLSDGSCGSIGYGIATAYAKEGANLVITGRNVKKLEDAKEELERLYGIKVLPVKADVSAGFYGVSPTGNGRRESFRYAPIPRMRATYMESGKADKESIIASVKKGIYVDQFSNGEVQIGEGDFTFFVKSGFLIENGRLTQPVMEQYHIQNLNDIIGGAHHG